VLRSLHIAVALMFIASSALASALCFCPDMGAVAEAAPVEEEAHGCCPEEDDAPGDEGERAGHSGADHDCPRCATGQCDGMMAADVGAPDAHVAFLALDVPVFVASSAVGPPDVTVSFNGDRPPPWREALLRQAPPERLFNVIQVIRC
jgi:hypothetical protein